MGYLKDIAMGFLYSSMCRTGPNFTYARLSFSCMVVANLLLTAGPWLCCKCPVVLLVWTLPSSFFLP